MAKAERKVEERISRREFLKRAVIVSAATFLSAYGISTSPSAEDRGTSPDLTPNPEPTKEPSLTPTETTIPTPTQTKTPEPTSTFTPLPPEFLSQSENRQITQEEINFLANHEISRGDKNRKVILITYDDGGRTDDITKILNVYKKYNCKTSFFVTGEWLEREPNHDIARQIVEDGHTLGCHGYEHVPFTSLTSKEIEKQLSEFIELLDKVIPGYPLRFFRPPYGNRNQRVREQVAKFGMQTVIWSLESGGLDAETQERVINNRINNGAIVLSHSTRWYDINQAENIVAGLLALGYKLESLDTGLDPNDYWSHNIE
jgi:peptidoglycan/xylan/chitin deacetylase (PgdA/CDA1 family)